MTILRNGSAELDVEETGQGKDLLLLHSLLTDRGSFAKVVPALAKSRRVLLPALPGFGKSTPAGAAIEDYADRIAAFLPALAPRGKPDVIANGFGGFVALALAARHGDRIGRLVLCDTAANFPESGRLPFRNMAAAVEKAGMSAIVDTAVKRIFTPEYLQRNPEASGERRDVLQRTDPARFCQGSRTRRWWWWERSIRPRRPSFPASSPGVSGARRCARFPIAVTARRCKNPRSSSPRSASFSIFRPRRTS